MKLKDNKEIFFLQLIAEILKQKSESNLRYKTQKVLLQNFTSE